MKAIILSVAICLALAGAVQAQLSAGHRPSTRPEGQSKKFTAQTTYPPSFPLVQGRIYAGVSTADLVANGWVQCFTDPYVEDFSVERDLIAANASCVGDKMLIGCGFGSGNLELGAFTSRSNLATPTTTTHGYTEFFSAPDPALVVDNEALFYNVLGRGMGFAPSDATVGLNSCDYPAQEQRMCWHTDIFIGGFSCGTHDFLQDGGGYTRYIFVKQSGNECNCDQFTVNPDCGSATGTTSRKCACVVPAAAGGCGNVESSSCTTSF